MLRTLILAFNHQTCGQMHNTNRRISFVNVLAARTGRAESINAQVFFANINFFQLVGFSHNRNSTG